jgi:chromosome segregation ATPase
VCAFSSKTSQLINNTTGGKSAILAAIMIGLGGKASVTKRGATLANLIRNGQSLAVVTVHLHNRGIDAFREVHCVQVLGANGRLLIN